MRRKIFALFFILLIPHQIAIAAPSCTQTTPDAATCGNGCYWDASAGRCTACPAGTINTKSGQTQCTQCEIGTYSDASRTKCNKCAIPQYGTAEYTGAGLESAYSCPGTLTCPAGRFFFWNQCMQCPDNTIAPNSSTITIAEGSTSWPTTSETSTCSTCPTNETSTDGINCICTGNFETVNGECTGKVYKITLDRNLNWADQSKEIWLKYATGYATKQNANQWLPNGTGTIPTYHWGHTFNGYYTSASGGDQVFTATGYATTDYVATADKARKFFTGAKTVYAHWDAKKYYVTFVDDKGTTIQTTTCTFGSNCYAPSITTQAGYYGNWKCTNGCNALDSTTLEPGAKIPSPKEDTTYYITMQQQITICPQGYYCSNNRKTQCPTGTSTSGTGQTTESACGYVRGSNGTKFCDSDGNCFTLPGSGIVRKSN